MLKKSIISLAILLSSVGTTFAADLKIGVVDIKAVYSKMTAVKSVSDVDEQRLNQQNEAIQALQKKYTDLQEKAKRDEMTLTNEQKRDIGRQLVEIESEIKLKNNFLKDDVNYAQQKQQQLLSQKILKAIQKVAEGENFDLVVKSTSIWYAKEAINITDKVAAVLNDPAG